MLVRYKIKNISEYNEYTLSNGKETKVSVFEFYDIEKPSIGDYISLDNSHFIKEMSTYTQPYSFQNTPDANEKDMWKNPKEYCLIEKKNKIFFLRRIYG